MADLEYPIVVSKLSAKDGGGYVAVAIDLKGCMGDGETPEEAIADVQEAILEWVDEARRLGRIIPKPGTAIREAHNEHNALVTALQKQQELLTLQQSTLKEQSDALGQLRAEVEDARKRFEALALQNEPNEMGIAWLHAGRLVTYPYRGKRSNNLPH